VLVLAASPGGLVVAAPVAAALQAELDVVAVTPIAIPGRCGHSVGAVTVTGPPVLARRSLARAGLPAAAVEEAVSLARLRSRTRERALRGFAAPPAIAGRTVIIVDDGLGIGVKALAAIRRVRRHGPARLLFATPVCVEASARALRAALAGEIISVVTSPGSMMAGAFYRDLRPASDAEVSPLLSPRRRTTTTTSWKVPLGHRRSETPLTSERAKAETPQRAKAETPLAPQKAEPRTTEPRKAEASLTLRRQKHR
jgi:predicted phosphoribosyltransferase